MNKFKKIISEFKNKCILVVGDVVLDQYIRGGVSRISPEAPVPVVVQDESFFTPGGSANVANNLATLGAKVILVGRIGDDAEGEILKKELKKRNVDVSGLLVDENIPTSLKTRIIAQHQQIVRVDREKIVTRNDRAFDEKVKNFIIKNMDSVDGVIMSDYGKGLITKELVPLVCSLAIEKKKVITVDPKVEHFKYYQKVTAITPNKRETENAIRNIKISSENGDKLALKSDLINTDEDINRAGQELLKFLELESLLVTLGEQGMRLFEKGKDPIYIKTKAQEVFDVSGAGDTVISVFTLGLTTGASKKNAAEIANHAAGIVVGKLGAVAVTPEELIKAVGE